MKWLLDTCAISELVSRKPSKKVIEWIDSIDSDSLYLSVITIGEIRKGIEKLPDSKRRNEIRNWLTEDLFLRFKDRLLPLDSAVMLTWGALTGRLEREGTRMSAIDSLIAATALHHDFILVTRNEEHFANSQVKVFNPWNDKNG
ncbi:MAG: type II toxin-antitoxin system VapC family toxin [Desulfobacteraceae bacterium]|nr:MAG: type II toxin-antitoxin system VapC family toxin [Desulfobacteraceae bacterium]